MPWPPSSAEPIAEADEPTAPRSKRRATELPANLLFARMLGFTRPYLGIILLAMALTLVFAGSRYVRAYLMKPLLDDVLLPAHSRVVEADTTWLSVTAPEAPEPPPAQIETKDPPQPSASEIRDSFRFVIFTALAIVLVMPLVLFTRLYLLEYALGRVSVDIKQQLAAKLLRLPLSFHRQGHSGDVLTRVLGDATTSEAAIRLILGDFLLAVAMVIGGAIALFFISWQLTLIALLAAPLVSGVVSLFASKIRKTALRRQEQLGEVTQRLVDILAGIKVIKAFGGEELERGAFEREAQLLFRRNMKVVKNRVASRSLVEAINGATGVGMIALGALLVMNGMWGISPGDVAAFATVLATTYRPIKTLSRGWAQLSEALASADRFFAILDLEAEPADPAGAIEMRDVRESIRFRGVGFGYSRETRERVLENIDLVVTAGEVIAVVGHSGAGKTTLMDLLLRYHEPSEGCIEIDGTDLRQITRASFLDHIAIVTQEPFLFDTSIEENIRYGRPEASHEEVLEAARAAGVDEFVGQLAEGYETEVGEFGLRLSGGQRQRITIARALLKDPAILVFDEATSALDAKTEEAVQTAIEAMRGERTLFLVAHRLSTIRRADRIVVMRRGRIVQLGKHEELMQEPGAYRDLVTLQQQDSSGS